MSNKSLYLVQSTFSATPSVLAKLEQLYSPEDTVILMGESVLQMQQSFLQKLNCIYVLENDAEILAGQKTANMQIISYAEFADICLNHTRCIRLN
ncbi:sulfur relay protein TusB [Acinetobacter sp. SFB]|uniref:DsrH/TusB family sulfur metabolism protein n=1 Tax=Acinetobacter sp. SFB TaxID=1805634 RepID=UPI0007D7A5D9|nr:DsrH/TusB family sulfur metabolism protein [Acinetobacter sp. SFB]OAL79286.1 sulfur relay protein TusB [Acinetobacter sp. SFB]